MSRRTRRPSIKQLLDSGDMVDAIPAGELLDVSPLSRARAICALTGYPAPDQIEILINLRIKQERPNE